MAVRIEDVEKLRAFCDLDPIRNAVMTQRIFYPHRKSICIADSLENPKAVAAIEVAYDEEETKSLALQGSVDEATRDVLRSLPGGKYWIHVANEEMLPLLRQRMRMGWYARAWLLSLSPGELKGEKRHETHPIDAKWAHRIASVWAQDWNADDYVRSRLQNGPSSGVFVDGELVAWGLTHFETQNVSALGFLNVMPGYRRRGFAESITVDMASKVLSTRRIPACHIYEENYASLQLSEHVGFRRVCRQIWGDAVTRQ